MAYEKLGFVDNETPLDAEHFNHMEEGIATPDWNQMQNKPTEMVGGDTLVWDGNVEGLEEMIEGSGAYKISSETPSIDDLTGVKLVYNGNELPTASTPVNVVEMMPGYIGIGEWVVVVGYDNFDLGEDAVIRSKGIYFMPGVTSLTIPGYTGFTTEKIAPAYLYQSDWNQSDESKPDAIKNRPFGIVYGDTLTWEVDYSQIDLENLPGGMFVKISDTIVTAEDLSNGCTIVAFGESMSIPADEIYPIIDGIIALPNTMAIFVDKAGVGVKVGDDIVFPQSGVYVVIDLFKGQLSIPGFANFDRINKIDSKYLPDTCVEQIVLYTKIESGVYRLYKDDGLTKMLTQLDVFSIQNKNLHVVIRDGDSETFMPTRIVSSTQYGGAYMTAVCLGETNDIVTRRFCTAEYTPETT